MAHEHDHDHEHEHEHDEELEELTDEEAQAEAERLVRKEIALSQIRQYGDPVLRMRAEEVEEFDDELRAVSERMIQLMHDAEGVGLAATQVGILRRWRHSEDRSWWQWSIEFSNHTGRPDDWAPEQER